MGRRKKQPAAEHRRAITAAAEQLFRSKGIKATTMDDIAQAAGYSKATLYVYFHNKEELISILVLASMRRLHRYLAEAVEQPLNTWQQYRLLCQGLVQYQEEYPLYFEMVLDNINIDFENRSYLPEEMATYQAGEAINKQLAEFLRQGIDQGDLRSDLDILPTIFIFWGAMSGLINLAVNKEAYIHTVMELSKRQFLEQGFSMLYSTISATPQTERSKHIER